MKAVYIEAHGGPEVLVYGHYPDPIITSNEVKVRVEICALNRRDLLTRAGIRGTGKEFPPPLILGCDVAGQIVEVGTEVKERRLGDRVVIYPLITCGNCAFCLTEQENLCGGLQFIGQSVNGGYAEYIKIPEANTVPIPDNVNYSEAACLPTTFLPTWDMLTHKAKLQSTETVLVVSGSGGVGTAAIQLAKRVIGARVIVTTSTAEKARKILDLGADEVIVYSDEDVNQRVHELTEGEGVDVVVDHVGTDAFITAYPTLRKGGRYGVCGVTSGYRAPLHMGLLFSRALTVFGVYMGRREDLKHLVRLLGSHSIRPTIDRIFPLGEIADAHRYLHDGEFFGKILVVP